MKVKQIKRNPLSESVIAIAVSAVIAVAAVVMWFQPTGNRIVYGNKVSTYITTEAGRKAEVAWLVRQGFNGYCGYGISSYCKNNPTWVQDFVLKMRRAGLKDIGFIYGSESEVLTTLDAYQKSCPNDSMKFSFVVSEIEQYQSTGNRPAFYKTIRLVSDWALAKGVKRVVYQGWPNQADCDSIVKYTDRMFLHAYGVYSNSSDVGSWVTGYTKGRMAMVADSKLRIKGTAGKYSVATIYSCENPDQAKTQFGYKYFLTHSVEELQNKFLTYFNLNAPASTKTQLEMAGSVLFVEDQFKVSHP